MSLQERLFFAERMDSNPMQLLHILVFQASSFNHLTPLYLGLNNKKNWFRKVKSNIISFLLVKKSQIVLKSFAGIFCPNKYINFVIQLQL
jgi:hypothetical protein